MNSGIISIDCSMLFIWNSSLAQLYMYLTGPQFFISCCLKLKTFNVSGVACISAVNIMLNIVGVKLLFMCCEYMLLFVIG
jgi:hypothetical protein